MPTKRKNARKPTNSKKPVNPSLNLVLKRLDKIDQRLQSFEQNTVAEFKAVRGEMAQSFDSLRQEFKSDMTNGFDSLRQEFKTDLQKELEKYGAGVYQWYTRLENKVAALDEKFTVNHNQLLTAMDTAAKNYDDFKENRESFNDGIRDLQHEVKELKKRDMEKAAAIEKIEQQLKAA